jgi:predicted dehydrogenase
MQKARIGIIGCGAISGAYIKHAWHFPILELAAFADIDPEAARRKVAEAGTGKAMTVQALLADPSIDIVLNLTIPKAHAEIALAAIAAGKHVYSEKPLGINRDEARTIMNAAASKGVRVGCAPDTVLGSGIQTARKVIDDGAIGRPVAFTAFMMGPGHESWHPNPAFYYQPGGGPMFDMGPYYLTALLHLLGGVKRITGATSIAIPQRTITHRDGDKPGPKFGQKIEVQTPDHVCGTMEFANGAVGTIITTFATRFPTYEGRQPITIYGTEGTLRVPDPNQFDGPVHVRRDEDSDWREVKPATPIGYGRATGLADMAHAIQRNRPLRASGELALAVVDLMQGFQDSSDSGQAYAPTTQFVRPAPMPSGSFGDLG